MSNSPYDYYFLGREKMLEQELLVITNRFKADSTKTGKEALLREYVNNENFKQYLKYILDPMYTFGLQDKKIKKFLGTHVGKGRGHINIFGIFEHLAENPTGTDHTANIVARFIDSFEDDDITTFLLESFTKKMKLGITAKTVNKVYGKGFLTNFEIMLAKKYEDESHKVKGEFYLTEKYDGQRCAIIKKGYDIKAFSRQGERILGLVDIEKSIANLPDGVYDGELLIKSHEQLKDREVLQQTLKITRKDGEKHGVDFYIFDSISLEEFENGISYYDYRERRKLLENLEYGDSLVLAPILYKGSDHDVIPPMLKKMEDKGREGLMLNIADAYYECKRTHSILKLKTMQTADLKVIGFEKGKPLGKYENTLGTLIVDYKGYPLGVSGFTDGERDEIWNNQHLFLGKIVEVQYFRESKNADGGLSVSFPQFKGVRHDKTEPSYY